MTPRTDSMSQITNTIGVWLLVAFMVIIASAIAFRATKEEDQDKYGCLFVVAAALVACAMGVLWKFIPV